jgi:regulator of sirC expression with transglutaminase-like and TPR domain
MKNATGDALFELAQLENDQIDLAKGALLIAKDAYADLDIEAYLQRLNQMAEELQSQIGNEADTSDQINRLNHYLFEVQGFAGSSQEHYYDPRNSYLNEVLERKTGIPITLSVVYMEIGKRIGLPLVGVGFPGHFIVKHRDLEAVIDPFKRGQILSDEDLSERLTQIFREPVSVHPRFLQAVTNKEILARMLRNLRQIHFRQEEHEKAVNVAEQITWLAPQSAQDYRDLGYLYYQVNAYGKSLASFNTYLRLSDDPPDQEEISRNIRLLTQQIAKLN